MIESDGRQFDPVAKPAARWVALGIAFVLLAVAAICGREFLIERNAVPGPPWIRNAFEWISRLAWQGWMLPVAVAAAVLGAALLVIAVKPRAATHLRTSGTPTIWLRPTDAARISSWAALHVDGVRRAETQIVRRRATVRVRTDGREPGALAEAVRSAVGKALAELAEPPTVTVTIERPAAR
ncbi:MAG: DUF6286 domain-containing protein [Candidatus Nanopelagicales bacterium]